MSDKIVREIMAVVKELVADKIPGVSSGRLKKILDELKDSIVTQTTDAYYGANWRADWNSDSLEIEVALDGDVAKIDVVHHYWEEDEDGRTGYREQVATVKGRVDGDDKELKKLAEKAARKAKSQVVR